MPKLLLAFALALLIPHVGYAQKPVQTKGMVTGFYELTLKESPDSPETKLIVLLRKDGDRLELLDLARKQKYTTKVAVEIIKSGLYETEIIQSATFEIRGPDKEQPLQMSFTSTNKRSLFAFITNERGPINVGIVNLPSVWACGNHDNPTHTAQSEAEIKDKTDRLGCSLWHKLKASDMK
jgi:hypothetical protein